MTDAELGLVMCDCGEAAHYLDEVMVGPWTTRMADHCDECHAKHVKAINDGPDDGPDGFRGTEAQDYASHRQSEARRVK